MTTFQYVVVKYVPNVLRDESVNVGVIARDPSTGAVEHRFLPRASVIKKVWPSADTQIVRHLDRALQATEDSQISLAPATLGRIGNPADEGFFNAARREFTGNVQLTIERGVKADDLHAALHWAYATFVAEPATSARPINYQALAPIQTRERVWRAFEKRQLIGPHQVRQRAVLQGSHAPWTFDLAYENGALHLINSLALNAGAEANLGRALVFKGMLDEVATQASSDIQGIAVLQWPKVELREEVAAPRAAAILEDAGISTYDVAQLDELADRVEQDLTHAAAR